MVSGQQGVEAFKESFRCLPTPVLEVLDGSTARANLTQLRVFRTQHPIVRNLHIVSTRSIFEPYRSIVGDSPRKTAPQF